MVNTPMLETATIRPVAKPPYLYGGFLVAGIVLHIIKPLTIFARFWLGIAIGLPLVFAGALLIRWAVRTLLRSEVNPRFKPVGVIVSSGPYHFTRNPMYLAFTCIYSGVAFAVDTLWPFALLPFLIAILYYGVIRREERYLETRFGDEYRAYRSRVRRWM